jgi:galactokinase
LYLEGLDGYRPHGSCGIGSGFPLGNTIIGRGFGGSVVHEGGCIILLVVHTTGPTTQEDIIAKIPKNTTIKIIVWIS